MAVYTHISEAELAQYLAAFDLGSLKSFAGIAEGVENTNYKLVTTKGDFILTLFEKRIRAEDLPFCLSFMEYLNEQGLPCPAVVAAKSGEKIVPLQGKPAAITSFLEGGWPRAITVAQAAAVGDVLAEMHLAGEKFPLRRNNSLALPQWKELIAQCGARADEVLPGLAHTLQHEIDFLEKNRPADLPSGAVHADLFPDNVFFRKDTLCGIIDFYFACTEVFVYDLMLALNAWCFETEGLNVKKSAALLDAYEQKRPLTVPEQEALPFFGRAAALRIVATRLYDWLHRTAGAVVKPKDPMEYVQILNFYRMRE